MLLETCVVDFDENICHSSNVYVFKKYLPIFFGLSSLQNQFIFKKWFQYNAYCRITTQGENLSITTPP